MTTGLRRLLRGVAQSGPLAGHVIPALLANLHRLPVWAQNLFVTSRAWAVLSGDALAQALWHGDPPRPRWHSFDRTPWNHPWLDAGNLGRFKAFNEAFLARAALAAQRLPPRPGRRYAFIGNIANNLYSRAVPLRRMGMDIDVFLHPHDRALMSQPGWEEYAGSVPAGTATLEDLAAHGLALPAVPGVKTFSPADLAGVPVEQVPHRYRLLDHLRYPDYSGYLPVLDALQPYDALLAVQAQYLAYLAQRPYLVTQMGGDIWFECSRDDALGRLQREAFAHAGAFIVSNPWSLAFARRYGLRNLVYLPFLIDDRRYAPGEPVLRAQWASATGGAFFVLMTARLDWGVKGSQVALEGFARFSRRVPAARLVLPGWGADRAKAMALLAELGIAGRVLLLPVAGKQRVIEYLRSAHCMLDQFVLGYFGGTALEAFGCGVPVIMRLERKQYDALLPGGAPPACDAATADEVCAWLQRLHDEVALREAVSRRTRDWFMETHGSERWGAHYRNLLALTAAGQRFDYADSPLGEPVGEDEQRYNSEQLALAPVFPSYS